VPTKEGRLGNNLCARRLFRVNPSATFTICGATATGFGRAGRRFALAETDEDGALRRRNGTMVLAGVCFAHLALPSAVYL